MQNLPVIAVIGHIGHAAAPQSNSQQMRSVTSEFCTAVEKMGLQLSILSCTLKVVKQAEFRTSHFHSLKISFLER